MLCYIYIYIYLSGVGYHIITTGKYGKHVVIWLTTKDKKLECIYNYYINI